MNSKILPKVFLGTWNLPTSRETTEIVASAIEMGYRGIDCAFSYGNDFFAGKAIKNSPVNREDLFITNKLWNSFRNNEDSVLEGCKKSLKLMKLDYFDLYLVHWPFPITDSDWKEKNCIVWSGMEKLQKEGLVRAIGTSNFLPHHLDSIIESSSVSPCVNQIEYHPGCNQKETSDYCKKNGIVVQGWSPLGSGNLLNDSIITEVARNHKKTPAQICLRWAIQNEVVPIPRTKNEQRLKENLEVFDFSLSSVEMNIISDKVTENNSGFHPDINQPVF